MPILDEHVFPHGGPYIDFVDLEERLDVAEGDWPKPDAYRDHIFFHFSDTLSDTLCGATRTYLPFDPYGLTQMQRRSEILQLSSEFVLRAQILINTPTGYLRESLAPLTPDSDAGIADSEVYAFHLNLLDTLLFLSGHLNKIAFSGRCLTIVGI